MSEGNGTGGMNSFGRKRRKEGETLQESRGLEKEKS